MKLVQTWSGGQIPIMIGVIWDHPDGNLKAGTQHLIVYLSTAVSKSEHSKFVHRVEARVIHLSIVEF